MSGVVRSGEHTASAFRAQRPAIVLRNLGGRIAGGRNTARKFKQPLRYHRTQRHSASTAAKRMP